MNLAIFYPAINNLAYPASYLARVQNAGEGNGYRVASLLLQIAIEYDNAAICHLQANPLGLTSGRMEFNPPSQRDSPASLVERRHFPLVLELLNVPAH